MPPAGVDDVWLYKITQRTQIYLKKHSTHLDYIACKTVK